MESQIRTLRVSFQKWRTVVHFNINTFPIQVWMPCGNVTLLFLLSRYGAWNLFLTLYLGLPCYLLCPIDCGRCNTVVLDIKKPRSFHLYHLRTLPRYHNDVRKPGLKTNHLSCLNWAHPLTCQLSANTWASPG